jgi:NitT/TauT family transport system substrate-binding protein
MAPFTTNLTRSRLLAGALATAAAAVPQVVRAQTLEKVRFTGVPTDDLTPVFYAIKNGLYQKAGVDLEFVPAASGSTATTAVVSGTYAMGKTSPVAALVAHLRAFPIAIIGNGPMWDAKNPFTLTLVANDSGIKTAADLNGKTISTAGLNDLAQLGVISWVDKNGGDIKSLKWVEIPNSAQAAAVIEHRTAACTLNEPAVTAAVETGKMHVFAAGFSAIAASFPIGVYMAHGDFYAAHPDLVRRWMRVTYEAAAYTNTHKAETEAMMSDITKIPLTVFQKMPRVNDATATDPASLQPLIDTAAKYGFIARAFPAKEAYV